MNQPINISEKNTGVLLALFETDWIAGAESGIVYQEQEPSGDWSSYLPSPEKQHAIFKLFDYTVYFDTFNCTNFSGTNCIETQINRYIAKKLLSGKTMDFLFKEGYLDKDGKLELSERAASVLSGNSKQGNYLQRVWGSYRHDGLLPDKDWAFPTKIKNKDRVWEEYNEPLPPALIAKAKRFLDYFVIDYEWVAAGMTTQTPTDIIEKHLKHAPLQFAHPVCSPWNVDGIVKSCGLIASTHATMGYGAVPKLLIKDYDSYDPFEKKLAWDYPIPWVMKGVVTPKELLPQPAPPPTFKHRFNYQMRFGDRNEEVKFLQEILKRERMFPMTVQSTGYYGNITAKAVLNFQLKHKVAPLQELNSLQGRVVGKKTLKKLNELYG